MQQRDVPVRFQPTGRTVHVLAGTRLFEAAAEAGAVLDQPCGGEGLCGKCRVLAREGLSPPSQAEQDLYRQARPGADYAWSLKLLQQYKARHAEVLTKSGLMLGLGETLEEVAEVMRDLREHDCDMLTLGQYLQPSQHHL